MAADLVSFIAGAVSTMVTGALTSFLNDLRCGVLSDSCGNTLDCGTTCAGLGTCGTERDKNLCTCGACGQCDDGSIWKGSAAVLRRVKEPATLRSAEIPRTTVAAHFTVQPRVRGAARAVFQEFRTLAPAG